MKFRMRIAIVVSRFNENITNRLLLSCREELLSQGFSSNNIEVIWVPGAYELPYMAQTLAKKRRWSAIICLGCVIKGETSHDQHVAQWASLGCGEVSLKYDVPVLFGVLTPNTTKQAIARSKPGPLNRGKEVAEAACELLATISSVK